MLPMTLGTAVFTGSSLLSTSLIEPPNHLNFAEKKNYQGYYVSFLHSIVATLLSLAVFVYDGGFLYDAETSWLHQLATGFSLGYFLYDMVYAEIFGLHDNLMRFHHVCVLIGGSSVCFSERAGPIGVYSLIITEMSNPFMQMRLILRARKNTETELYRTVETLFAVIFIFNRGVLGSIMNYNVYFYNFPLIVKLNVSLIYATSLVWIVIILKSRNKKIKEKTTVDLPIQVVISLFDRYRSAFIVCTCLLACLLPPLIQAYGYSALHMEFLYIKIT